MLGVINGAWWDVLKTQSKIRNTTCHPDVEVLGFTYLQKQFWLCLNTKFRLKCEWAKLQFWPMVELVSMSEIKPLFIFILSSKQKIRPI